MPKRTAFPPQINARRGTHHVVYVVLPAYIRHTHSTLHCTTILRTPVRTNMQLNIKIVIYDLSYLQRLSPLRKLESGCYCSKQASKLLALSFPSLIVDSFVSDAATATNKRLLTARLILRSIMFEKEWWCSVKCNGQF